MEVTHPRFILAEVNTHRDKSRNSASSRAIPVEKRISQIQERPFVPEAFTLNKRGMSADAALANDEAALAQSLWLDASVAAVQQAKRLADIGVHKQHANRILEPYAWHTAVITATEWENFFKLRAHPAAQPEMQITARKMLEAYEDSDPNELAPGEWHLPYVDWVVFDSEGNPDDNPERSLSIADQIKLSVVRCAAVSYERQYADRTIEQAVQRHDEMVRMAHWSPFEHQAQAMAVGSSTSPPFGPRYRFEESDSGDMLYLEGRQGRWVEDGWFCGNFRAPWVQYRKMFSHEAVFRG
jgi:thymidylate synthase ThyX